MDHDGLLSLIGRDEALFQADLARHGAGLDEQIASSRFLVVGDPDQDHVETPGRERR